jgi:hypothetical protein
LSELNEFIIKRLGDHPMEVIELATEALKLSEKGLPEVSVAEALESIVRRIIKQKGVNG